MARPQQTATELSRTLAGQLSKSEKRSQASRAITEANKNAHAIVKSFRQQQRLK